LYIPSKDRSTNPLFSRFQTSFQKKSAVIFGSTVSFTDKKKVCFAGFVLTGCGRNVAFLACFAAFILFFRFLFYSETAAFELAYTSQKRQLVVSGNGVFGGIVVSKNTGFYKKTLKY